MRLDETHVKHPNTTRRIVVVKKNTEIVKLTTNSEHLFVVPGKLAASLPFLLIENSSRKWESRYRSHKHAGRGCFIVNMTQ